MAGKKKTNPSRIPAALSAEEAEQILEKAARDMAIRVRAAFLGAVIDYDGTSAEELIHFLDNVGEYQADLRDPSSYTPVLSDIERKSGVHLPSHPLQETSVHSKKDAERFRRFAQENAAGAVFSAMLEPSERIFGADKTPDILRKANDICAEMEEGQISIPDIAWALETEFGLYLDVSGARVRLRPVEMAAV